MKILWAFFLLGGMMAACQSGTKKAESQKETETIQIVAIEELELNVEGMTCTGCENTVVNSLKEIEGITEASASHKENKVTVRVEKGKLDKEKITRKIESIGYTVKE